MELFHANRQWATRPADERFRSLDAMYDATKGYADGARESSVQWGNLAVINDGNNNLLLQGSTRRAPLTNYAFKQLSARAGAPAAYVATLPADIAADVLNHGLRVTRSEDMSAQLLLHPVASGSTYTRASAYEYIVRALTTERYARLWNHEVIDRLRDAAQRFNLVPAAPTFRQSGDDAPALYASDHDMFAFLMTREREIIDPVGQRLFRGAIVYNSEVGDKALGILRFWFRDICGNHIIWGAEKLVEARMTHVGDIQKRWNEAILNVKTYLDGSATIEQAKFNTLRKTIGGTKEEVLDFLFGKRVATRKALGSAYDAVVVEEDGDPNTLWGMAQGLTRHSQTVPFADERQELDRAAGKILDLTF